MGFRVPKADHFNGALWIAANQIPSESSRFVSPSPPLWTENLQGLADPASLLAEDILRVSFRVAEIKKH